MGFDVGKFVSHSASSIGHTIATPYNDVKSVVSDVGKAGSQVYKDSRSAVSFAGKHLISDVDNISSMLSNPMIYIVGGVVIVVFLMNK